MILEALTMLQLADKTQWTVPDAKTGTYKELAGLLSDLNTLLLAIPDVISRKYFKHAQGQKQLFALEEDPLI